MSDWNCKKTISFFFSSCLGVLVDLQSFETNFIFSMHFPAMKICSPGSKVLGCFK